jgi:hypothetical protein
MKREANFTTTENGATALKSTNNYCLDAFGSLGAMRKSSEEDIISTFSKAYAENTELALRMLFYIRDIRGGQGERRIFRILLKWLAENRREAVILNLENILFYGRGDDYLCLLDTSVKKEVIDFIKAQITSDVTAVKYDTNNCSLLAKWLPSINASSPQTKRYANILCKGFGITPREYRKLLSRIRAYLNVVERKMSAREWTDINYGAVPAKASMNYSDAFFAHDEVGYTNYIQSVAEGKAKINAKSLFPVDIIHSVLADRFSADRKDIILNDARWKALPDYFKDRKESAICMVDTSGSMGGTPYEVAVSLGIYCADKCSGPFKNHFITFAETPHLVEVVGKNIYEKVANLRTINAGNTDIEVAFQLILDAAVAGHCTQDEIPSKLYIISDMQFDAARGGRDDFWGYGRRSAQKLTFMERMREKFAEYGYTMPAIVYWNVRASKNGMFQDTVDGENVAMVSGYSPSLFEAVIKGTTYEETINERGETVVKEKIDPVTVMINTLMDFRYDRVVIV